MGVSRQLDDSGRPFLKWAGGKRWLCQNYSYFLDIKFERYIEPFVGGGSVFFYLAPDRAILSDANERLIEVYRAVRDSRVRLITLLREHQRRHSKAYYYDVRSVQYSGYVQRAAQFLYLNRTCWNGLYRVNTNGEFNVPIGTKNDILFDAGNFPKASSLLRKAEISACDFEETIDRAGRGDFVFVDPPYTVKHNFNGFVKYNEDIFKWQDQERLAESIKRAKKRGAMVVVTNADHSSIRDLYEDIGKITSVSRNSVISGDPKFRGEASEVIIQCL